MTENPKLDSVSPASEGSASPGIYHAGTLRYTKPALAMLFFWLLWGDFCYMLMEAVTPSIMPLKFQALGASNTEMGLVLGTIPMLIYSVLNPIISFKSDRFRSRWGRRIPFIAFSLPFIVLCLLSLGYAEKIGFWLQHHSGSYLGNLPPNTVAIWTLTVFLVVFAFFNTFISGIFWYLFNDVVPEQLLARFMSWFRLISMVSGALYNFCIFRYAGTHATAIFLGAAALYFVGFTLMCLNVKEGQYPPPPPFIDGESGPVAAIKTYAVDCHSFPIYWNLWLTTVISTVGGCVFTFTTLFQLAIGLNLAQIGDINGSLALGTGALILISGWLADKYHPIRITLVGVLANIFVLFPANLIWFFCHPSPQWTFWVAMFINVGIGAPAAALVGVWDPPMLMRLFPRSRYGQFCSTNGIWRSIGGILGGIMAGAFLDFIAQYVGKDRAYYCIPLWQLLFGIPSFYFFLKMYQNWKQLGADESYVPPVLTDPSTEIR